MELNKIEKEIFEQLLVGVKNNKNLGQKEIEGKIMRRIRANSYFKKDYEIDYAKGRIKKELLEIIKPKQDNVASNLTDNPNPGKSSGWRKHFSGKNLLINGFISFIPVTIIYRILSELGFGGVLVLFGLMFIAIYLTGSVIEKISSSIKKGS